MPVYLISVSEIRFRCNKVTVNLTIIGSDNGLPLNRHQAITWANAVILLIGPSETNFSETLIITSGKCIWERRLKNTDHLASASMCQIYFPFVAGKEFKALAVTGYALWPSAVLLRGWVEIVCTNPKSTLQLIIYQGYIQGNINDIVEVKRLTLDILMF